MKKASIWRKGSNAVSPSVKAFKLSEILEKGYAPDLGYLYENFSRLKKTIAGYYANMKNKKNARHILKSLRIKALLEGKNEKFHEISEFERSLC